MFGNNVLAENMKGDKVKTKIKIGIILVLSLLLIIICWNIYKQSPRYIIKDTVMWYEKDFTIPLFCKKVKFEYDDETGEYAGKFLITKKQADKIKKKLTSARARSGNSTHAENEYKGEDIRELSEKILNTTVVSKNLLYTTYMGKEKKRDDIDFQEIFPESWLIENEENLILLYRIMPQYGYARLFNESDIENVPISYVLIYMDKEGKYYFCIKRAEYSNWKGLDMR